MRKYLDLKNLGGGFLCEFQNCVYGLYSAVKHCDSIAVGLYCEKLDVWGLEWSKQNNIIALAKNDGSVGIPTSLINSILIENKAA